MSIETGSVVWVLYDSAWWPAVTVPTPEGVEMPPGNDTFVWFFEDESCMAVTAAEQLLPFETESEKKDEPLIQKSYRLAVEYIAAQQQQATQAPDEKGEAVDEEKANKKRQAVTVPTPEGVEMPPGNDTFVWFFDDVKAVTSAQQILPFARESEKKDEPLIQKSYRLAVEHIAAQQQQATQAPDEEGEAVDEEKANKKRQREASRERRKKEKKERKAREAEEEERKRAEKEAKKRRIKEEDEAVSVWKDAVKGLLQLSESKEVSRFESSLTSLPDELKKLYAKARNTALKQWQEHPSDHVTIDSIRTVVPSVTANIAEVALRVLEALGLINTSTEFPVPTRKCVVIGVNEASVDAALVLRAHGVETTLALPTDAFTSYDVREPSLSPFLVAPPAAAPPTLVHYASTKGIEVPAVAGGLTIITDDGEQHVAEAGKGIASEALRALEEGSIVETRVVHCARTTLEHTPEPLRSVAEWLAHVGDARVTASPSVGDVRRVFDELSATECKDYRVLYSAMLGGTSLDVLSSVRSAGTTEAGKVELWLKGAQRAEFDQCIVAVPSPSWTSAPTLPSSLKQSFHIVLKYNDSVADSFPTLHVGLASRMHLLVTRDPSDAQTLHVVVPPVIAKEAIDAAESMEGEEQPLQVVVNAVTRVLEKKLGISASSVTGSCMVPLFASCGMPQASSCTDGPIAFMSFGPNSKSSCASAIADARFAAVISAKRLGCSRIPVVDAPAPPSESSGDEARPRGEVDEEDERFADQLGDDFAVDRTRGRTNNRAAPPPGPLRATDAFLYHQPRETLRMLNEHKLMWAEAAQTILAGDNQIRMHEVDYIILVKELHDKQQAIIANIEDAVPAGPQRETMIHDVKVTYKIPETVSECVQTIVSRPETYSMDAPRTRFHKDMHDAYLASSYEGKAVVATELTHDEARKKKQEAFLQRSGLRTGLSRPVVMNEWRHLRDTLPALAPDNQRIPAYGAVASQFNGPLAKIDRRALRSSQKLGDPAIMQRLSTMAEMSVPRTRASVRASQDGTLAARSSVQLLQPFTTTRAPNGILSEPASELPSPAPLDDMTELDEHFVKPLATPAHRSPAHDPMASELFPDLETNEWCAERANAPMGGSSPDADDLPPTAHDDAKPTAAAPPRADWHTKAKKLVAALLTPYLRGTDGKQKFLENEEEFRAYCRKIVAMLKNARIMQLEQKAAEEAEKSVQSQRSGTAPKARPSALLGRSEVMLPSWSDKEAYRAQSAVISYMEHKIKKERSLQHHDRSQQHSTVHHSTVQHSTVQHSSRYTSGHSTHSF